MESNSIDDENNDSSKTAPKRNTTTTATKVGVAPTLSCGRNRNSNDSNNNNNNNDSDGSGLHQRQRGVIRKNTTTVTQTVTKSQSNNTNNLNSTNSDNRTTRTQHPSIQQQKAQQQQPKINHTISNNNHTNNKNSSNNNHNGNSNNNNNNNNRSRLKPRKNHMPKSLIPCRYGIKCQNPACKFLHTPAISPIVVVGENEIDNNIIEVNTSIDSTNNGDKAELQSLSPFTKNKDHVVNKKSKNSQQQQQQQRKIIFSSHTSKLVETVKKKKLEQVLFNNKDDEVNSNNNNKNKNYNYNYTNETILPINKIFQIPNSEMIDTTKTNAFYQQQESIICNNTRTNNNKSNNNNKNNNINSFVDDDYDEDSASMIAYACDVEDAIFEQLKEKIERRQNDKKEQKRLKVKQHKMDDSIAAEEMRIELDLLLQEQEQLRLAEADEHFKLLQNQQHQQDQNYFVEPLLATTANSEEGPLMNSTTNLHFGGSLFLTGFGVMPTASTALPAPAPTADTKNNNPQYGTESYYNNDNGLVSTTSLLDSSTSLLKHSHIFLKYTGPCTTSDTHKKIKVKNHKSLIINNAVKLELDNRCIDDNFRTIKENAISNDKLCSMKEIPEDYSNGSNNDGFVLGKNHFSILTATDSTSKEDRNNILDNEQMYIQGNTKEENIKEQQERERFKLERKAAKKARRKQEKELKASDDTIVTGSAIVEDEEVGGNKSIQTNRLNENEIITKQIDPEFLPIPRNNGGEDNNLKRIHSPTSTIVEDDNVNEKDVKQLPNSPNDSVVKEQPMILPTKQEKSKKNKMVTSKKQQQKEEFDKNTRYWLTLLVGDTQTLDMLVQLCAVEFCRAHNFPDRRIVLQNDHVKNILTKTAQKIYQVVCKNDIQCRVVVRGHSQNDLNNRFGKIERWDEKKGQFFVGLDTRRGKKQYVFFSPGNLEVVVLSTTHHDGQSKPKAKTSSKAKGITNDNDGNVDDDDGDVCDLVYLVHIPNLLPDKHLRFDVFKSDVDAMRMAPSLDEYLSLYINERQGEEVQNNQQQQQQKSTTSKKESDTVRQKSRKEWKEHIQKVRQANANHQNNKNKCDCVNCCLEQVFFGPGFVSEDPQFFDFTFADNNYKEFDEDDDEYYDDDEYFDDDDDDADDDLYDDDDDDDDDDEYFYYQSSNGNSSNYRFSSIRRRKEYEHAATTLGVSIDASSEEIKRQWRRLALKYHPDKHCRNDNNKNGSSSTATTTTTTTNTSNGGIVMTKEEAEVHFKEIGSAYNLLMEMIHGE